MSDKSGPKLSAGQSLLENAYELKTPQDSIEYYKQLASGYDTDFAEGLGYAYPAAITAVYRGSAAVQDVPIADIGCGTGLVAEALQVPAADIDGMDISAEMLQVAKEKGLYRALHEVDLTASLAAICNDYGAVVSAGTFTSGHLGPKPLQGLLDIARPGGLFVIGVNKKHFEETDFNVLLQQLQEKGLITELNIREAHMYSKPGYVHSEDVALILSFRKV
jgi:predicted TPR repeat methyltransferase